MVNDQHSFFARNSILAISCYTPGEIIGKKTCGTQVVRYGMPCSCFENS